MRKTAILVAAFLAIAASGTFSSFAQDKTLILATEGAYPPFNAKRADGQLEGFDIDIGNALCKEMQVKCEWVVQDWDGMIPALQGGKFDAIVASMFITDERLQKVDFTDRYYLTPTVIAARTDSAIAGVEPKDLAGKTVGVQGSSVYLNYAEAFLQASHVKSYPGVPEMLADLAAGRIEAVADDAVVVGTFLKSPEGACCRLVGTVATDPLFGKGAGIALRKNDPLIAKFNAAIEAIRVNGKYKAINDRYFDFDIYGAP